MEGWPRSVRLCCRVNVTRLGTDELEAELQIQDALEAGQQHTVLARVRLRRGGQGRIVRALLFIPPHRSTGNHKALGQASQPGGDRHTCTGVSSSILWSCPARPACATACTRDRRLPRAGQRRLHPDVAPAGRSGGMRPP